LSIVRTFPKSMRWSPQDGGPKAEGCNLPCAQFLQPSHFNRPSPRIAEPITVAQMMMRNAREILLIPPGRTRRCLMDRIPWQTLCHQASPSRRPGAVKGHREFDARIKWNLARSTQRPFIVRYTTRALASPMSGSNAVGAIRPSSRKIWQRTAALLLTAAPNVTPTDKEHDPASRKNESEHTPEPRDRSSIQPDLPTRPR